MIRSEPKARYLSLVTTPETGHYPAVKTKRQTFIPIHKCLYQFCFKNLFIFLILPTVGDQKWTTQFSVILIGVNQTNGLVKPIFQIPIFSPLQDFTFFSYIGGPKVNMCYSDFLLAERQIERFGQEPLVRLSSCRMHGLVDALLTVHDYHPRALDDLA